MRKKDVLTKFAYTFFVIISIYILAVSPSTSMLMSFGSIFSAEASPGENVTHNLTVSLTKDEPHPINIQVNIQNWYQDRNGANLGVENNPDISPYSAKNLLSVSPKNFSLAPGEHKDVKIEGIMPSGNGGRYAIVYVHTISNQTGGVALSFGMNSLVLLTIKNSNLIKKGEIENLSLIEPISPITQNISMIFHNTGNYHYIFNTSVALKDEKGNTLATASAIGAGAIIPTARRMINLSLNPDSELKTGNYIINAVATLMDGTILANKEIKFEIK